MPLFEGVEISPDDAIAKALCPECAVDLTKVNALAHRAEHWKIRPVADARGVEALRRMELLDTYIGTNNVRTSNMPTERPDPMRRSL